MAKLAVEQWDIVAANNTEINSIPLDGAVTVPSQVDDIVREMMAQVASQIGEMNFEGADIASATTTNLANATGWSLDITGTTTITGFGTVAAGKMFMLRFVGALTLTHNATSLILPGAANITTAAGDVVFMKSEGSGNWRCMNYQRAAGLSTVGPSSSTDNTVPRFNGTSGAIQTSGVTVDDSNNVTGVVALTTTGAFTSVGIDDNATGERLQLADTLITVGTSSGDMSMVKANADGVLYVSGGSANTTGANLFLAGGSHATLANDWGLRSGASDVLRWDDSAAALTLTGAATFTGSAGSRLVLDRSTAATNSVMSFTTTGSSVHLGHGAASTFAIKMSDNNIANTPLLSLNSSGDLAITGGFSGTTGTFSGAVSGTTGTFSSTVAGTTVSASTAFRAAAGSAGTPSISFTGDTNTGLYSYTADEIGVSVAGAFVGNFSATALNIGKDTRNAATVGSSISADGQALFTVAADTTMILNRTGADGTIVTIRNDNVTCGTISISGAATAYNESSDGRRKKNLRDFDSGGFLDALEVWHFDWISGGEGYGVIAQDANQVFPHAITYDEQNDLWMADYSKFVPLLLAEVKALRARVAALEV